MQFFLVKNQKSTLFEQAREQLLTALHMGKLRVGDRLPSVRQVARHNSLNIKTALSIYQRLSEEGHVDLRVGSGAYVANIESVDLEQAYCLSLLNLIKSNLAEACRLNLDPPEYANKLQNFIDRSRLMSARLAVIECSEEQIGVFAREISDQLSVHVCPILLSQLKSPDCSAARMLTQMSYFATTDFHFKEVKDLTAKYQKKLFQLRLNPAFIPKIVSAARDGPVLMVVSNTSYFPAFCRSLLDIGTPRTLVERITAVDNSSLARLRAAVAKADAIYVSPICDPRLRKLIPAHVKELKFDSILARESIEMLKAVMLFDTQR